jgi:hypothetical protein
MSLVNGTTYPNYYKPVNLVHSLSADEAGSGEVILPVFNSEVFSGQAVGVYAEVTSSTGVPRVLTKKLYVTADGTIDITGTSFATGDLVTALAFKYFTEV